MTSQKVEPVFFFPDTQTHAHTIHSHSWGLLWRPHTTLNLGSIYTFSPHQNQKKRGEGAPTGGRRVRGRTLVEDGCRSVVDEGGAEVDLQGTVTAGRGGAGQRGAQWEFGGPRRAEHREKRWSNPKKCPSLPSWQSSRVGTYCEFRQACCERSLRRACRTNACRVSVFINVCDFVMLT